MAVVSSVPQIKQRADPIGYPDIGSSANMASKGEIVKEPVSRVIDDILYVAVGDNVKESRLTLLWAVENSRGRRICILHVYVPAQTIPMMGAKFPVSSLKEQEVRAHRESERSYMQKILDDYLFLCRRMGVWAEKLHVEAECIEKGILELISQHGIRRLVMGAAADKHHSKKMMDLKSKKANYVRLQAPVFCHIQFICKGHLIYTREASLEAASSSQQANLNTETGHTNYLSQSFTLENNNTARLPSPAQNLLSRVKCDNILVGGEMADSNGGLSAPQSQLYAEGSSNKWDGSSKSNISEASVFSSCSPSLILDESLIPFGRTEGSKNGLEDGSMDDALYDQIEQAVAEGKNAKQEAFQEALRRRKAEKDALEAMQRAKASENSYAEELKQRKETEEVLAKEKEQLGKMKKELNEVIEELTIALDQKSLLERQIADSDQIVKELEEKIISAVELLQNYKNEKEGLKMECGIALKEAEELRKARGEGSSTQMPQFCADFSFSEIEEATRNFDLSLKIGEGGYGSIYKATLRHTQVAIKMLHSHSLQGPSEFQQEVDVLGKLRHPNLVTLVGACPEAWILIYEYLPNGSLEDRLSCRDNTPPLSWQTRIRIATELCSVLIFLHSCKPHSIVHGDLKPANILLDSNFVSKLSDFGICRLLTSDGSSSNNTTQCCRTNPKGTFVYMDPEFLASGELTTKSDVYSFGIILLRLLTARPALRITREVQYALDTGNLKAFLDPLAGDWPFVQAEQLTNLALRCCDMNRKNRPDLALDVWRVLEPMKASCGSPSSLRLRSEDQFQPPPYFICPIFQEVMQDPHVAADGFTYEAEALRGWLDSGHDTSPMTNEKLAHCSLVPNLALRSAIQEWLQQN